MKSEQWTVNGKSATRAAKLSGLRVPLGLTGMLLAARIASAPALSDPVSTTIPERLHLSIPALYLILSPVFTLWDGISMLSMSRLRGFLIGLILIYLVWRVIRIVKRRHSMRSWPRQVLGELGILVLSLVLLLGFLVIGALWHRPMASLAGTLEDERVVDFHSHTSISHDVRGTLMENFDAETNRRWHTRAGFDVAFITDHNVVSRLETEGETVLCPGIEVSAWRAHIILLGDTLPVDRGKYNASLAGLLELLAYSERVYGSLSVASLPEYRRNHWARLDTLVRAGLDGFEIVNASPKANELTRAERDSVISLARANNLFVVGVSDSHGWGATNMVWNVVPVSAASSGAGTCGSVLDQLRCGFPAAQVVERHRLRADAWWPLWLTPIGVVWETWRSMGWGLTIAWLLWIWLVWAVFRAARRHTVNQEP
ncbi:MAG TPA: hypothetical protein VHH32_14390 [Gemmatimonadales bacterium]|nr:hypothetical protein [Gemmatimonadales bacterium]